MLDGTVSVGEQQHQAIETGVCDLRDVGGTPADGLNGGGSKRFVLALHIGLEGEGLALRRSICNVLGETAQSLGRKPTTVRLGSACSSGLVQVGW